MAAKEHQDHESLLNDRNHPVGTGVGAAGGAVAGAAAGTAVAGPAGTVVGGVIGAIAGGLAGRGMAHAVNHEEEDAYWRENHTREPYYNAQRTYDDYQPAYRMGWESRARYDQGDFDSYEPAFRADWESRKGTSRLGWEEARHAARAGWDRVERALPGDADGDGR